MAEQLKANPPPAPPSPPAAGLVHTTPEQEKKISLLEKRLQEEREKVLLASLKSKEEAEIASRVEVSVREVQDKLRRGRREAEMEETRLKLEARVRELEERLLQERESASSTLQQKLQARDIRDQEVESRLSMRIQDIERRWLEEKAYWQRLILAKEEEARQAKATAASLKGIELERQKTLLEKGSLEERVSDLAQANGQLQVQAAGLAEREKEFYQSKADLAKAQEQVKMMQERFDRELQALRLGSREREDRLLADNERLQAELRSLTERLGAEREDEIRRLKAEYEEELRKTRAQAELSGAALKRMRAVSGALEKQTAALRAQAQEAKKAKEELQGINEKYQAEFIVLQRKWQDREADIRSQAKAEAQKGFEAEKERLKARAQEQVQNQALKLQQQVRADLERESAEQLRLARAGMDEELARQLSASLENHRQEMRSLDHARRAAEESARKAGQELAALRQAYDELRGRLEVEEERRELSARDKVEQEKTGIVLREKVGQLENAAGAALARAAAEERRFAALCAERENWGKLRLAYELHQKRSDEEIARLKARLAFLERVKTGSAPPAPPEGA